MPRTPAGLSVSVEEYLATSYAPDVDYAPPFLCIEILSPEGRLSRTPAVAQDYLSMGVPHVWILDAQERKAYRADASGLTFVAERISAGE